MSSAALGDLKDRLARRQVTLVIGAGVSIQATDGAPCASWKGLLRHGAARAADVDPTFREKRHAIVEQEIDSDDLDNMLGAAEKISRALGAPDGGSYRRWLRDSVGSLRAQRNDVLDAIRDLGAKVATTNYDGLLETALGIPAVTWRDEGKVERILRDDERGVFHVHGYWDEPESVVLGTASYDRVIAAEHAQAVLRALRLGSTLLFVGCGAGLEDPNFEQFRSWLASVMRESEYPSYRLARDAEYDALAQLHGGDMTVLKFGPRHEDLAPFLRSLAPPSADPGSRSVVIAGIQDVERWGWTVADLMRVLIDMDYREMEATDAMEGTVEEWVPIFEAHPETWRLLAAGPRDVLGYACFVPLLPEFYASARAGTLLDPRLRLHMIPDLDLPGEFDVYFISICIERMHRRIGYKRKLFAALVEIVLEAARNGAFIREVCTNASTAAGEAVCHQLGMQPGPKHVERGTIYTMSFRDMIARPLFNRNEELLQLYGVATPDAR